MARGWRIFVVILLTTLLSLTFPSSKAKAAVNHCGDLVGSQITWSNSEVHVITCNVTITAVQKLTIQSGTVIKFTLSYGLIVNGTLEVQGTSGSPVYFTSIRDDYLEDTNGDGSGTTPAVGNWTGIQFNDSSNDANSIINCAIIRFAGWNNIGNIHLNSASPTIQNTVLTYGVHAIRANLASFPILTNNTYENNNWNAFAYDGGTYTSNATWNITDTSYFLIDNVCVGVGATLPVQPGVVVKFQLAKALYVDGALRALGTASAPIYFTSLRDDTVGGNIDSSSTLPGDVIIFDTKKKPQPGDVCIGPIGKKFFLIKIDSKTYDRGIHSIETRQWYPIPEELSNPELGQLLNWYPLAYDDDTHEELYAIAEEEEWSVGPIPSEYVVATALRLVRQLAF